MKARRELRAFAALLALTAIVMGCGVLSVPDKMDSTNEKLDQTLDQLKQTNVSTHSMVERTDSMDRNTGTLVHGTDGLSGKMDSLNDGMGKTTTAIHLQTLAVAEGEMFKDDNTAFMQPTPIAMFPGAQVFADEIHSDELAKYAYGKFKEINETTLDAGTEVTAADTNRLNQWKLKRLNALLAIAGLVPQATIEKLVKEQLTHDGPYRKATLGFLLLRANCIRDVNLNQLEGTVQDIGVLEDGIEQVANLDYLARLPYAGEIALQTTGFAKPMDNITDQLDPTIALVKWRRLKRAVGELDPSHMSNVDKGRVEKATTTIGAAIDYWTNHS